MILAVDLSPFLPLLRPGQADRGGQKERGMTLKNSRQVKKTTASVVPETVVCTCRLQANSSRPNA
jgi:hypothetical protein